MLIKTKKIAGQFLILFVVCTNLLFAQDEKSKKVAVVSICVNRTVDASLLSDDAVTTAAILKLVKDSTFNLKPVLDDFQKRFFDEFAKQLPFSVLDEKEVLNNPGYQNFKGDGIAHDDDSKARKFIDVFPIVPPGYKYITPDGGFGNKKNLDQNKVIALFPGIDGVMFIKLGYFLEPKMAIGGMGTAGLRAILEIIVYNKEGKHAFTIREGEFAKKTLGLVKGVPTLNTKDVLPMCIDATNRLFAELPKSLPKIIKKTAKKL